MRSVRRRWPPAGGRPPLADADTQAVTVAALRALAELSGDSAWTQREGAMRVRLTALFGPEVLALEAGALPVGARWALEQGWTDARGRGSPVQLSARVEAGCPRPMKPLKLEIHRPGP